MSQDLINRAFYDAIVNFYESEEYLEMGVHAHGCRYYGILWGWHTQGDPVVFWNDDRKENWYWSPREVQYSAKMKGQADVTISPQVSGQLMKILVTEGQQVRKGQTLFVIDSRNAQLNEATNMYNGAMGIIALYVALGGATR